MELHCVLPTDSDLLWCSFSHFNHICSCNTYLCHLLCVTYLLLCCYYLRANTTTVDQIASDIASSFSSTHLYSKVTSNGVLPSLPIAVKQLNPHLNLSHQYSGSLDGKWT